MTIPMNASIKLVISRVLHLSLEEITDNCSSESIVAWDSLAHMRLVLALEEEFGISFDDVQIVEMTSLAKISQIIESKV